MSNEIAVLNFSTTEMQTMARAMAGLFQKKPEDLFALMLIAQAENKHPAIAAQEYDIINGRPALKSQATLARFQASGGRIKWLTRTDEEAKATFTHPIGGELTITWNKARAEKAGLWDKKGPNGGKTPWQTYPGQMLSSRVVAEGIRAIYPLCLSGFYTSEEVEDIPDEKNITPEPKQETEKKSAKKEQKQSVSQEEKESATDAEVVQTTKPEIDPEYARQRTDLLKEIGAIVGAPDAEGAWTQAEREAIEIKPLAIESGKTQDIDYLKALLLRAQIGNRVRNTEAWNKVIPAIVSFGKDIPSLEAALTGLESKQEEPVKTEPETKQTEVLEIYG